MLLFRDSRVLLETSMSCFNSPLSAQSFSLHLLQVGGAEFHESGFCLHLHGCIPIPPGAADGRPGFLSIRSRIPEVVISVDLIVSHDHQIIAVIRLTSSPFYLLSVSPPSLEVMCALWYLLSYTASKYLSSTGKR
jgi:hypothetical protein